MLSSYLEKTVAGPQLGTSSLYRIKKGFGVGGFYQTAISLNGDSQISTQTFYGILLMAPLIRTSRLNLIATLRSGLVNDTSIVMVPAVETEISLSHFAAVAIGVSHRMGYPAMSARFCLKLFTKQ